MAGTGFTRPTYAVCAAICPVVCIALGAALALARPGGADLVASLVWTAIAALSSVFCAIKSVLRRERWQALALAGALMGLIPISMVLIAFAYFRRVF